PSSWDGRLSRLIRLLGNLLPPAHLHFLLCSRITWFSISALDHSRPWHYSPTLCSICLRSFRFNSVCVISSLPMRAALVSRLQSRPTFCFWRAVNSGSVQDNFSFPVIRTESSCESRRGIVPDGSGIRDVSWQLAAPSCC